MAEDKANQKNNKDDNNITTKIIHFLTGQGFANGLAIILILGSVVAIIYLITVHSDTISKNKEIYNSILNNITKYSNNTDKVLDSFEKFYRESNAANTNVISILLPVFGAWIGAIIAFYYGNKSFDKLSQSYKEAVDAISTSTQDSKNLAMLKAGEVLEKYPDYKEVSQAKISDQVGKSFKKGKNPLLLKDDADKTLGFMYIEDILSGVSMTEESLNNETKSFKDFIIEHKSIIDKITTKKWTENGLQDNYKNYIELNVNDTLLTAKNKMETLTDYQKVRCLVLDDQRQIKGIITARLIAKASTEQIEEQVIK